MTPIVYPERGATSRFAIRACTCTSRTAATFLQTTDRQFDLITGEPPPPGIAGVENLYSREYFQLLHDRLADGGIVDLLAAAQRPERRQQQGDPRARSATCSTTARCGTGRART